MTLNQVGIYKLDQTESTNSLAKDFLRTQKIKAPFLVQADAQTKGKGQMHKTWESESGLNLLCSLVVQTAQIPIEQQFTISKIVAVAIQNVISRYTDNVSIKWPNDIYVGESKISGVLIENIITGNQLEYSVIGIGLNVNQIEFSALLPNPTSLKLLTHQNYNIDQIRDEIVSQIIANFENPLYVHDSFEKLLFQKGELNWFKTSTNPKFLGVIVGVEPTGKLLIRVEDKKLLSFANSEIEMFLPKTK
jgi:BirA family biotin operon repressor/biotin-[acetyl-CoA-carboxylase] ligase